METPVPEDLRFELASAGPERLEWLLETLFDQLDLAAVRAVLENSYCDETAVRRIHKDRRLVSLYEVRHALVQHRKLPLALALQIVPGLFWRDLIRLSQEARVRPQIRRAAEFRLIERMPSLAVGEKVSLARKAAPRLISVLGQDPNPRVCSALMDNPRLTEGTLLPWITRENAPHQILRAVARNPRWGVRYPVRLALCRNPRTPVEVSLPILPLLKRSDLVGLASERRLPAALRQRAKLLTGH